MNILDTPTDMMVEWVKIHQMRSYKNVMTFFLGFKLASGIR